MSEITITITADEDDLRAEAEAWGSKIPASSLSPETQRRIRNAVAITAALPKPRIVVRPGMLLRRRSDGVRWFICADGIATDLRMQAPHPTTNRYVPEAGLDPDEWEVILDV